MRSRQLPQIPSAALTPRRPVQAMHCGESNTKCPIPDPMRDRVRQFMVWATKIPREEWSTQNPRFYMAVRRQDLCPSPRHPMAARGTQTLWKPANDKTCCSLTARTDQLLAPSPLPLPLFVGGAGIRTLAKGMFLRTNVRFVCAMAFTASLSIVMKVAMNCRSGPGRTCTVDLGFVRTFRALRQSFRLRKMRNKAL